LAVHVEELHYLLVVVEDDLVGPNHPRFFGGGGGLGIPQRGGGRGMPPTVPRGARFDPYGPIVPNRGNPNPDELRPPQFNNDGNQ